MKTVYKKEAENQSIKVTLQRRPIPGKEKDMAKNNAGGYSFVISPFERLERFLILGSEGGTYYATAKKLTKDNTKSLLECLKLDWKKTIDIIVDVSVNARGPKNDTCIFSLAVVLTHGSEDAKTYGYNAIQKVCRIGTHIFQFLELVTEMRGWSSGLRKGVAKFYTSKNIDQLTYQLIKYRQRQGWRHIDVLRLAHIKPENEEINDIFKWVAGKNEEPKNLYIQDFLRLQKTKNVKEAIKLITKNKFTREAVPTEFLNEISVWEALLIDMPYNALLRTLNVMTSKSVLKPMSDNTKLVIEHITNVDKIKKSKIHPLQILLALTMYQKGKGDKGNLTWQPIQDIVDALNEAFYLSFDNVQSTGKKILIGIDVSGSMTSPLSNMPSLTARSASAALALVFKNVEKSNAHIMGFTSGRNSNWSINSDYDGFVNLKISPKDRLDKVIEYIDSLRFGRTDCSLPIVYADKENLDIDCFIIITDNETYAGKIHPVQALKQYNGKMKKNAKLIVIGMTSTGFSIADPMDKNGLDIVGFDMNTPQIITSFLNDYKNSTYVEEIEE